MSYTDPTPTDLKARFPAFNAVDNAAIQTAIDEAGRRVDQTWPEEDYTLAKMLYAAHVMTLDGLGAGREAKMVGLKSMQLGQMQFERTLADNETAGALNSTSYGRRFLELVSLNFAGGTTSAGLPPLGPGCW